MNENMETKKATITNDMTNINPNNLFQLMCKLLKPRIDSNVTVQFNHLIKVPYSVHPNTGIFFVNVGNLCVFLNMDFAKIYEFDPENCLNVKDLSKEFFKNELSKNILESGL
jgi:DNA primase catalytic subunit